MLTKAHIAPRATVCNMGMRFIDAKLTEYTEALNPKKLDIRYPISEDIVQGTKAA